MSVHEPTVTDLARDAGDDHQWVTTCYERGHPIAVNACKAMLCELRDIALAWIARAAHAEPRQYQVDRSTGDSIRDLRHDLAKANRTIEMLRRELKEANDWPKNKPVKAK